MGKKKYRGRVSAVSGGCRGMAHPLDVAEQHRPRRRHRRCSPSRQEDRHLAQRTHVFRGRRQHQPGQKPDKTLFKLGRSPVRGARPGL